MNIAVQDLTLTLDANPHLHLPQHISHQQNHKAITTLNLPFPSTIKIRFLVQKQQLPSMLSFIILCHFIIFKEWIFVYEIKTLNFNWKLYSEVFCGKV